MIWYESLLAIVDGDSLSSGCGAAAASAAAVGLRIYVGRGV